MELSGSMTKPQTKCLGLPVKAFRVSLEEGGANS